MPPIEGTAAGTADGKVVSLDGVDTDTAGRQNLGPIGLSSGRPERTAFQKSPEAASTSPSRRSRFMPSLLASRPWSPARQQGSDSRPRVSSLSAERQC